MYRKFCLSSVPNSGANSTSTNVISFLEIIDLIGKLFAAPKISFQDLSTIVNDEVLISIDNTIRGFLHQIWLDNQY